jgi:hypothetical protein
VAANKETTQPDKLEKIKRFEKEKKAMQKKQEGVNRTGAKVAKTTASKPKRTGKNWTRVYEDGMYDTDDYDYDFS